jgi:hypothetical protein
LNEKTEFANTGILQKVGTAGTAGTVGTGRENSIAGLADKLAAIRAANRVAIAILELELLGYAFELSGPPGEERLRYHCTKEPKPDPSAVRPWLRVLKTGRRQAVAFLRARRTSGGRPFDLVSNLDRATVKAFESGLRLLAAGQEEQAGYEFGRAARLREAVQVQR